MRNIAKKLGTTATAIYRYFSGKEEIFLRVRERGFNLVYQETLRIFDHYQDPIERLQQVTGAIKDFSLREPYYYKIMMTWDIPTYLDFKGTPLEPVAYEVKQSSSQLIELYTANMEAIATKYHLFPKEDARSQFFYWLTGLHGILSLYGNTIIIGIHEDPYGLLDLLMDHLLAHWSERASSS